MFATLGIVEVGQLPRERSVAPAGRRFGGKSLLEWVVRRVTDTLQLDQVLILAPQDSNSEHLREIAPTDVPLYFGTPADPLARFAEVLRQYPTEGVVKVGVENPFVDPVLIDRLITSASGFPGDYVSYCFGDGRLVLRSQLGMLAEWCRSEAIERADREATAMADRADATRYIYSRPELFQLRLIPVPSSLDRADLRLKVDVEEDWEHAQAIFDALGPEGLDFHQITGLLDHNPAIRERMADLNRAESN